MPDIRQAKILIIATNGFEQSELEVPRDELRAARAEVHVATPDGRKIRGWAKSHWGRSVPADLRETDSMKTLLLVSLTAVIIAMDSSVYSSNPFYVFNGKKALHLQF